MNSLCMIMFHGEIVGFILCFRVEIVGFIWCFHVVIVKTEVHM